MEYKVVSVEAITLDGAISKLQREVNKLCREGWKPQGSMSTREINDPSALIFNTKYHASQPMVK